MSKRELRVRIWDENISGCLRYMVTPDDAEPFDDAAIAEVEHIRSKVGTWYDFTGEGDALLNSANCIIVTLETRDDAGRMISWPEYMLEADDDPREVIHS